MIPRHVETIFCDDIRQEVSGKVSLIGVYSSRLFVQSFPVTLPKLCLSVKVVTPADEPLQALSLRVLRDEEIMQEITIDEKQLAISSETFEELTDKQRKEQVQSAQFILVFSPIQFDGPCTIRVRVITEDRELKGIALKVEQAQTKAGEPSDQTNSNI